MPAVYGNLQFADDAREGVVAQLTALMADMATNSIVPALSAVYPTHNETPAPTFYYASVGIDRHISAKEGSGAGVTVGSVSKHTFEVSIRIGVSNSNEEDYEQIGAQLVDSVINWIERTRNWTTSHGFRFTCGPEFRVAYNQHFTDIAVRGALISFVVMDWGFHS